MNLYEYQGKDFLREAGILIPQGDIAYCGDQAVQVAKTLGGSSWVVKAQILAGGRGKAGGILFAHSLKDVEDASSKLLGSLLVTPQTSFEGERVQKVYVEELLTFNHEYYLSFSFNRDHSKTCLVASFKGGVNIEEAFTDPCGQVVKIFLDPCFGIQSYHLQTLKDVLKIEEKAHSSFDAFIGNLYKIYLQLDATLLEINPLILTAKGQWIALDAKISIDDNALYRQPRLLEFQNNEGSALEKAARQAGLNYVKLDGNIGCIVNGAGLAMATMDLIQSYGLKAANFLDVGGTAAQEQIEIAFQLLINDSQVKAIFINIFGGIVHCDVMAKGIIKVAKDHHLKVPLIVRLQGTHHQLAKDILTQSDLNIAVCDDMSEVADKIINVLD